MAKILLVEDDDNLREIYEARLLAEGYEIISARDGEEALAMAVKERPDLVISDIMMPKISGFDMLDILRSTPETKSTKVIMMTALSQVEDKNRADALGADRYLIKSQVTLEDVAKAAREVLEDRSSTATAKPAAAEPIDVSQPAAKITTIDTPLAAPVLVSSPALPVDPPVVVSATAAATPTDTPAQEPLAAAPLDEALPSTSSPPPAATTPPLPSEPPATTPVTIPDTSATKASLGNDTGGADPTSSPTTQFSQPLAEEEAAIDRQIQGFAQTPSPSLTPFTQPSNSVNPTLVVPPAVTASPPEEEDNGKSTRRAASEPSELKADPFFPSDADTSETTASASPVSGEQEDNRPPSARKLVIQPIHDVTKKPDFNQLAEQEEAREAATQILASDQEAPPSMPPTPTLSSPLITPSNDTVNPPDSNNSAL